MSSPTPILFPVETINRELDARLALAALAADDHNRIFIGLHDTLMRLVKRLRGGVYLGKSPIRPHFPEALGDYHRLKAQRFIFLHFDTEGAVYPGTEYRWRQILFQRLDPRHLEAEDYICTWGDFQRDAYRSLDPACATNIRTTGHPGFDLYRPRWRSYFAPQARRLRARFGDFVLINTNLARANNRLGPDFVFSPYNGYRPQHLDSRLHCLQEWAYKHQQLSHVVQLVHRLQLVFPDVPLIVRPHPSEDPAFYDTVFQGLPSVHVLHEGPVAPWLLACRCMIHDGCTTGLEAHLGEAKIITFSPVQDPGQELFLPNQFGVRCDHEDHVVDCLIELFHGHGGRTPFDDPPLIDHRARRLLHNLCGNALPAMLEILREAQAKVHRSHAPRDLTLLAEEALYETLERFKNLVRPLSPRHRRTAAYARGKFPGFDVDDVAQRMARLQQMTGQQLSHQVISRALIVVEKARR